MRIQRVEHFDAISISSKEWDRLSYSRPFLSREWLESWWRPYGKDGDLFLLVGYDHEGTVVGIAPFWKQRRLLEGTTLSLLGNGEACSDYMRLLTTPECEPEFLTLLADWLVEKASSVQEGWDVMDIDAVSSLDPSWKFFFHALNRRGCKQQWFPAANCWRLNLPSSWDEYLASMSKNRRKQLRHIDRDWYATGRAVQKVIDDPSELQQGLDHLCRLHQLRRQSLGEPGCFTSPAFSQFLSQVALRLHSHGSLRLYLLEIDGQVAAAEFALKMDRVTYLYQGGFDPALAKFSPGQISTLGMIRHAIEQGCKAFDFLRGDEDYKARWRAEPVPNHRVRIAATSIAARFRDRFFTTGFQFKSWLKGYLPTNH